MLKKKITLLTGISIAVSMVVGSGLFGLPGLAVKSTDALTALTGWLLVILIMPSLIHIFSWLGRNHPSSEGISLYASMGFGSWSRYGVMLVTCGTLAVGMPAFFLVGGSYIVKLLGIETDQTTWAVYCAIALAAGTTCINLLGVEKLGFVNKLVVLFVLGIVGYISVYSLPQVLSAFSEVSVQDFIGVNPSSAWLAMAIVFWAFQGWENMTFGFEEIENPNKNIPLIYWLSFAFVSLIYLLFALVVSAGALRGLDVSGLSGVTALLPKSVLGRTLLIVIVFILIANANSWVFGCSRAFYSAARAGVLPKILAVTDKRGIPVRSLLIALLIYMVVIFGMWLFHLDEKYAFLLTTQGFILLYGGAVLAFIRATSGLLNRAIAVIALTGWFFLMQGFGWLILYPFTLLLLGLLLRARTGIALADQ